MFHGIIGTVVGHHNAYKRRKVLHRDVSDGNTIFLVDTISAESAVPPRPEGAEKEWTPMRNGVASDWGSATDCLEPGGEASLPRTGTLPFESNASMLNTEVEFYHDLESYFWLAYLITCNCAGPFNMRRDWDGEIQHFTAHKTITPSLINHLAKVKTYGKVLDVDRSASASHHANEPFSPLYLSWVRPGVHSLSPLDIVQQRDSVSDTDFANLMTPYFVQHEIIRDGMIELRSLFSGPETKCSDGFELEYARARYQRYLDTGNRMPLMVDDDDPEGRIGSKRKGAQSDARFIQGATKRARGPGASEAGFGAPVRRGAICGTRISGKTKGKMKAIA
ncbi:uncharacterized protein F5891DRAFT_1194419 [Suillus fuscotomentosus]|uniref:Fungal-type protein kinase domain-containing protein n=1 Tax=Suillus fuscotomentosus TaxID=1912939 RepID=A0AAD4HG31_9AGAM|nr:uncharacterized protein F5891DRAFT_1194419 [Suillus fuscotomentosus]KAG1895212.1 hypothetical protein F5891DRAFT_1194419 [Suillus fuscotomentosus]